MLIHGTWPNNCTVNLFTGVTISVNKKTAYYTARREKCCRLGQAYLMKYVLNTFLWLAEFNVMICLQPIQCTFTCTLSLILTVTHGRPCMLHRTIHGSQLIITLLLGKIHTARDSLLHINQGHYTRLVTLYYTSTRENLHVSQPIITHQPGELNTAHNSLLHVHQGIYTRLLTIYHIHYPWITLKKNRKWSYNSQLYNNVNN